MADRMIIDVDNPVKSQPRKSIRTDTWTLQAQNWQTQSIWKGQNYFEKEQSKGAYTI